MKITFLGTGTSQGVPVIACHCPVCSSGDVRDRRLRSSILIQDKHLAIVVDTGPDFRYQMLRAKVDHVDGVVFTHEHKDHTAGLDDIRAFNHKAGKAINIYASQRVQAALKREFSYIFSDEPYPGIPRLHFVDIDCKPFMIGSQQWIPIKVMHYKLPILGFRIGDFTYITDAKTVPAAEMEKIRGTDILVLNALQQEPHISHLTLQEAIAFSREVGAQSTYLTHISHRMGLHAAVSSELPYSIHLAYDQLVLTS